MSKVYLENVRQIFLHPPGDIYYEGRDAQEFDNFIKMLGYIVPNQLTPEELMVYLKFLIKDIKDKTCRFQNSKPFKDIFERYINMGHNLDMWMTYFPSFAQAITSDEFYSEFIELFKKSFYQLESEEEKEQDYGCVEIRPDVIDISNKDKAEVLAALYNHSKPIGMGIIQYDPTPMTVEVARMVLEKMGYSFDYLKGRTMKVNLEEDTLYVALYNRDNNQPGLAQRAISTCHNIDKNLPDLTQGATTNCHTICKKISKIIHNNRE